MSLYFYIYLSITHPHIFFALNKTAPNGLGNPDSAYIHHYKAKRMTNRTSIYSCNFCEKQVNGLKFVKKHQNVCSSNPDNKDKFFKCIPCNHSYTTNGNLHKHNITCPTNRCNTKPTCEFCTKEFTSLGIENHIPHCHLNPNGDKYEPDRKLKESNDCIEFIDNKYTKLYFKIINSTTPDELLGYTEKHHIVPRSFGGSDDKSNLVKLSARKHYVCHLLLTKMVEYNSPEYHKMVKSYLMMANMKGDNQDRSYKVNSKLYETLRCEFSKQQSINQSGSGNSHFGSMWVYNPISKESKRIGKNDTIENGWFKGRVTDWNTHFTQRKCNGCGIIGTMSYSSEYCSKDCMHMFVYGKSSNSNNDSKQLKKVAKLKTSITGKTLDELIHERSKFEGDCLIWQKSVTTHGLPQYVYEGKNIQVHKYMYEKSNDAIVDKNHVVKQTCGNTKCINPLHLIYKTKKEHHHDNIESYNAVNEKQSKTWNINGIEYSGLRKASKETGLSQCAILKHTIDGVFNIESYHQACKNGRMKPKI